MQKILIVEDDMVIANVLKQHLQKWNYEVKTVSDFKNVMECFLEFDPHMVLMDISLPFFNGYHWCTEIRKRSQIPVIFLSAASDNMNIVMAISMGGDDFIAKPFDLTVVTAKIQAWMRRTYTFQNQIHVLERQGVVLNIGSAELSYQNKKIELTKNDFKIMQILMEYAPNVVPREEIMKRLWESDEFIDDNTLTVNITRLRKKLEENGIDDFIRTRKGIGYYIP
ncbi:MAG TPA: response regulator transcription factor [Candidatus Fimimorpha faecalis]|uniref:Stage 0 sporulation protein A homolog n=1 Tax=Candidatus Fimimorpha faecalis TaxID=2840824 RepID=A0A9D1JDZ6_9FIRM|nr:response regulator transcription factor [Candidatus Fimimorpha faecalis]